MCRSNSSAAATENEGNKTGFLLEEPESLRFKLLAVYLAEELNQTTQGPIYGAHLPENAVKLEGQAPMKPRAGPAVGLISATQNARRIWTNPACDIDGDGIISDCDISASWKYSRVVSNWVDLVQDPNPTNPVRHNVPAGTYRFAVLQTCLQNLDSATMYEVQGADMGTRHAWGGANATSPLKWPNKCFHLTRPFATPLVVEHGDEVVVTLSYSLPGSFRSLPFGSEHRPDWECFVPVDDPDRRHCARLPAITPVVHRSKYRSGNEDAGLIEDFSLSMMPPSTMCYDWRYLQAIGAFQMADYDGSNLLIYGNEFDVLFRSLRRIGVGIDATRGELDSDGDSRVTYEEYVGWLTRIGLPT